MNVIKPFVSVIIPAYNQGMFLGDAIESVLSQTYTNYEIVVVDDGSTDNCKDIVASYQNELRYLWHENKGLAGARNTGIRAAKGELIGLLDADDQWQPSFLERMVDLATRFPEAAVYYCSARGIDIDGNELPQIFGGPVIRPDEIYHTILRANFLIPSTIVFRRAVVVEAGLFDQQLRSCEDWDLWLRILPEKIFIGTSDCLVRYRIHGSSLSTNPTGMQKATRNVIEKHFGSDDGEVKLWSQAKRRAYGGVYRYHLLTSIQRENNWDVGALFLRQAFHSDPSLATDVSLFYDLALGSQPIGYRGTPYHLDLKNNAGHIHIMLNEVFKRGFGTRTLRQQAFGTAYFALGLVAYNTDQLDLARRYLPYAIRMYPKFWRDKQIIFTMLKSSIGTTGLNLLRKGRQALFSQYPTKCVYS